MAVRPIRIWPDQALSEVAAPVEKFNDDLRQLVRDLFDTMYENNGVGLAATQIAVPQRVVVIDLDPHDEAKDDPEVAEDLEQCGFDGPRVFVNPRIVEAQGALSWDEACLSLPGISETVRRKERVVVEALDENGEPFRLSTSGLFAVAVQHETDHLDGRVFVDYLSKLKRDVIRKKMERLKEQQIAEEERSAAL